MALIPRLHLPPGMDSVSALNNPASNKDDPEYSSSIMRRATYTYPMIKQSDLSAEARAEVMEMCVNACEKHTNNNESAAKMIKEALDKR